ncbi:MAG: NIL domain-containing protein [Anaerolineales bacterium]|jgi:ABC-type methionine transport system ATPase subunit|nr:NIL domain-containing protein [Anaerolineales bacterium]MBX3004437.1 NIL domain-containing protein [Anaerolineales bacterium]MCW5887854.1 NIL domain-containing protein [Anaerolineales bacterium]
MTEQVVRLIYPPAAVNTPVVTHLIRNFNGLTVNIMHAETNSSDGWIEVQLAGTAAIIEAAIDWLRKQGIEVQVLGH